MQPESLNDSNESLALSINNQYESLVAIINVSGSTFSPQSIENVYIGVNMYALGDSLRNEPFFIVINNLHFTALVKRNDLFKFETISNTCRFSV